MHREVMGMSLMFNPVFDLRAHAYRINFVAINSPQVPVAQRFTMAVCKADIHGSILTIVLSLLPENLSF